MTLDLYLHYSENITITESTNIFRIFQEFINRKKQLFNLYCSRNRIRKKAHLLNRIISKNPRFSNKELLVRGYGNKLKNFESISVDDEIMLVNNILSRYLYKYKDDNTLKATTDIEVICEEYMKRKAGWDNWYTINVDTAATMYDVTIDNIDKSIKELKKSIYNFSTYVDKSNMDKSEKEEIIVIVLNTIKDSIDKKFDIMVMNMEAMKYEMVRFINEDLDEASNKVVVNKKEPSARKIMKTAELYDTITYGGDTYNIYKTNVSNISCFNYGGHDIYLDKDFFDLPKGYQLAILYHEIGHNVSGHFGLTKKELKKIDIPIEDEEKLLKRIKKDIKNFTFHESKRSIYRHTKDDEYYEELLYILVELDADRFSIKNIGKRLMSNSLHDIDRNMAKGSSMDDDMLAYNSELVDRRRYMM